MTINSIPYKGRRIDVFPFQTDKGKWRARIEIIKEGEAVLGKPMEPEDTFDTEDDAREFGFEHGREIIDQKVHA